MIYGKIVNAPDCFRANGYCLHHMCDTCCQAINASYFISLQWRHNVRNGVSNHQPHHCLLKRLFRRKSKKTPKLRVTGLCTGNSPVTAEFLAQGPVTRKMFPFDNVIMLVCRTLSPSPCIVILESEYRNLILAYFWRFGIAVVLCW